MTTSKRTPGHAARGAFRLGVRTAIVVGLAGLGALYWSGALTLPTAVFVLLALFPVYLVLVAAALSVWLGYDKDATDLRPVHR
ncbi:MAG: hypothetical protein ABEJ73_04070 [Haloplanus sp.]